MAAPILRAPGISWLFLQENIHAHRIPCFRGEGGFGFWGGSVNFIFMGAGISLTKRDCWWILSLIRQCSCRNDLGHLCCGLIAIYGPRCRLNGFGRTQGRTDLTGFCLLGTVRVRAVPCRWKLLSEVFLGILYAKENA